MTSGVGEFISCGVVVAGLGVGNDVAVVGISVGVEDDSELRVGVTGCTLSVSGEAHDTVKPVSSVMKSTNRNFIRIWNAPFKLKITSPQAAQLVIILQPCCINPNSVSYTAVPLYKMPSWLFIPHSFTISSLAVDYAAGSPRKVTCLN